MSHLNKRSPTGDDVTQRSDMKPAFGNNLFERVLHRDNISAAWKRVRANKGAAGIDGMTNFGIADGYHLCVDLDQWIRRRIRMAYWRQWRKLRTKVRNLMRRGVRVQAAVACGITSKGPWRSSKTPGLNQALSNAYLKSEGLYSLRDGWIKLHYPK